MTTTSKDIFLLEKQNKLEQPSPVDDRQWITINDQNNGVYQSGKVKLNTSVLSSSGKRVSYSEGYLSIPYVIVISGVDATPANVDLRVLTDFKISLKNGMSVINTCKLDLNNTSVLQQNSHLDMLKTAYWNMGMNGLDEKYSYEELLIGKDNPDSLRYALAANNLNGHGLCNNTNHGSVVAGNSFRNTVRGNSGFQRKMDKQVKSLTNDNGMDSVLPANHLSSSEICHVEKTEFYTCYHILLKVPLTMLSDVFAGVNLNRSSFFNMEISVNESNFQLLKVAADLSLVANSMNVHGETNPVMVASAAANNGMADIPNDTTLTVTGSVVRPNFGGAHSTLNIVHATQQVVKLHVPLIELEPGVESKYLELHRSVKLNYTEYNYSKVTITAGANMNHQLNAGISNPRWILIVPQLPSTSNQGISSIQSPFCSCPAITAPTSFSNFNVKVNGKNLFQERLYRDKDFFEQLRGLYSINSNMTPNIQGGISFEEFVSGSYKYYFVDLSRNVPLENNQPTNIQVDVKNEGLLDTDLHIFVGQIKTLEIDNFTGARLNPV